MEQLTEIEGRGRRQRWHRPCVGLRGVGLRGVGLRGVGLRGAAVLAGLLLLAGACGGSDDEQGQDGEVVTGSGAEEGEGSGEAAFPVTIEHKYGEITIEQAPERVVSIGFSDHDDLLALGVSPIAVRDWYGDKPFATWPWAEDALGDAEPELLSSSELNFEQIAALRPDLIVGVSSGITQEEYATLSQIAPTLAQSGDFVDYGVPWQERTAVIGQAVGQAEPAAELVAGIDERFSVARAAHPEFEGASAAVAFYFEEQPGAYTSSDTRSRIMTDLGFSIPPEYDDIAGDAFFASFSAEEIALLDVDVLVWLAATDAEIAAIGSSPLREGLTAAIEGREVFVGELLGGAFSFASPLSLGYLLDELVPELAAAADGDPATEVPSAAALGATGDPAGEGDGEEVAATADEQAAMDAWALVFDSAVPFDDKSPHLEDADQLEPSNAAYAAAGEELGGISLDPTGASVDGDAATVTYDVLFGGTVAYSDLTGTISMIDGVWTVTRNDYCGFLSSAQTPCEAP